MVAKAMFSALFPLLPLSMGISTLTSCGAEDSISRRFHCRFMFHTQNHPGNTLEIALNGFGSYTFVSASYKNNIWHIYSTPNDGRNKTEDIRITAATELQYAKVYNIHAQSVDDQIHLFEAVGLQQSDNTICISDGRDLRCCYHQAVPTFP